MTTPEEKTLIDLLALAIHQAHVHDPNHPHDGQKWPQLVLSTEEAVHYGKAVINALAGSGLQIGEKNNVAGQASAAERARIKKLFERV